MRIAVVADGSGGGSYRELGDRPDGRPGPEIRTGDLASAVAERSAAADGPVRWVWADTADVYPELLAAGVRVDRCHDAALVEALLLGREDRFGEPRGLGAAWARLHGRAVPDDRLPRAAGGDEQPALFDADTSTLPAGADRLGALAEVHADQRRRCAALPDPGAFALLCAVESAGALAAAEMHRTGVPWDPAEHDRILTAHLGARPAGGAGPPELARLAQAIAAEFGRDVNPDSPAQLIAAFADAGVELASTRAHALRRIDHPAVPLLLRYKELARLHAAHGWQWLDTWVRGGRFHPDYVVGGVVSGRWATRGGGALQIPKALRSAIAAEPGHRLVTADAGQLEPRILAAVSGDPGLARAAGADDLYATLGADFGDRQRAKIGRLAAMYGQTGGDAAPLLTTLYRTFPDASALLERAAADGERGRTVRSWLGRAGPPPSEQWSAAVVGGGPGAGPAARSRGRFTRNFVVQASAAEWALVFMAAVRRSLAGVPGAELVLFQHDELLLHVPEDAVDGAVALLTAAADEAGQVMFGATPVRFLLDIAAVQRYADADAGTSTDVDPDALAEDPVEEAGPHSAAPP